MRTDRPLFSIITITLNNLDGLKRTADSVRSQSLQDYEWIVIDGASRDGTKAYLGSTGAKAISEPDRGIYDAMNKGMDSASGDYLLFLNAGDILADMDILSTLSRAIDAAGPDFIYADALETGGLYKKARSHEAIGRGMFTHHQSMLYRRDLTEHLRYDIRYTIAADYGFTALFLRRAKTVHYVPCAICVFENGGVSEKNRTLGRREQFRLRRELSVASMPMNMLIYMAQSLTAHLRERVPFAYRMLRTARFRA